MNLINIVENIQRAASKDKLVVFIGAGVSKNSGFKLWQEVIKDMDRHIGYTPAEDLEDKKYTSEELLKIPQFLYDVTTEGEEDVYQKIIVEEYGRAIDAQNPIVDAVLKLNPKHIITTNFDQLIEKSLDASLVSGNFIDGDISKYTKIVKDSDMINAPRNHFFIKMHGDTNNLEHLVLKENDYLGYSITHSFIETFIKTLFVDHTFLFVGYGVNDYNLKLIMAWVENIANKQIGDVKLTQHYFINPEETSVNKFEKRYLEKHNINVFEYNALEKTDVGESVFANKLGDNLYRCCLFLEKKEVAIFQVDQIAQMLKLYDEIPCLCFRDLKILFNERYFYSCDKNKNILYIEKSKNEKSAISIICHSLIDETTVNTDIAELFKRILLKCGITKIEFTDREKKSESDTLKIAEDELLAMPFLQAIMKDDCVFLRNCIEDVASLKKGYALSYFRNKEAIAVYEEIYKVAIAKKDYYLQLLVGVNKFHASFESFSSVNLRKLLPDDYLKYYQTLCDYIDCFNEFYLEIVNACEGVIEKYAPDTGVRIEFWITAPSFDMFRTEIQDMITYFICNYIDVDAKITAHSIWGNYHKCVEVYISTICKLSSGYSQKKLFAVKGTSEERVYPEYKLNIMDLYLLTNWIDSKKFSGLLKSNKLSMLNVESSEQAFVFLIEKMKNLRDETNNIIAVKDYMRFYDMDIYETLKRCLNLFERIQLEEEQYQILLIEMEKLVLAIMPLYKEKNVFLRELIESMLRLLESIKLKKDANVGIDEFGYSIVQSFVEEVLRDDDDESKMKLCRFIIENQILVRCSQMILPKQLFVERQIEDLMELFARNFYREKYWFLASVFPFSDVQGQDQIRKCIESSCNRLNASDIYALVALNVVEIQLMLPQLLQKCEEEKERYKKDDAGNTERALHVAARLYEKNYITDLTEFEKYAEYNYFFSFVCFPEKFDYYYFNVNWYSWFSLERYATHISGNIEILKPLFDEEMMRSASEKFKAIYYKYFVDLSDQWVNIID